MVENDLHIKGMISLDARDITKINVGISWYTNGYCTNRGFDMIQSAKLGGYVYETNYFGGYNEIDVCNLYRDVCSRQYDKYGNYILNVGQFNLSDNMMINH